MRKSSAALLADAALAHPLQGSTDALVQLGGTSNARSREVCHADGRQLQLRR